MTQTPLQKAIQYVKEELLSNEDNTIRQAAKHAIQILTDLLPYEREVIEGAFHDGNHNEDFDSQSDYFTKTFINNEPHSN